VQGKNTKEKERSPSKKRVQSPSPFTDDQHEVRKDLALLDTCIASDSQKRKGNNKPFEHEHYLIIDLLTVLDSADDALFLRLGENDEDDFDSMSCTQYVIFTPLTSLI
jgi:hypothetical protein